MTLQRVAIVTGAFGALGAATVRVLLQAGWSVASIDAMAAPRGAPQGHPVLGGVRLDDWAEAQAAVERVVLAHGRLDALVNIAGGFHWDTIADGDPATWSRLYDMNVRTALHACKAALPHIAASGRGRVVNVGAAAASRAALGMGAYAASKSAVLRLTEALAEELKPSNGTANAVLPSILDTPANRASMGSDDAARWVAPDALARVIAFLLSDDAAPITGAGVPVTGKL